MANYLRIITSGEIFIIRDKANLKKPTKPYQQRYGYFLSNKASILWGNKDLQKKGG